MKFKSPVYSEASGSIAGITYSHNRGGMYTRQRVVPTNPGTQWQQAVRTAMQTLSSAWVNTLTSNYREAWELYATQVTVPNVLGDPIYLTGLQHYVRSNVPRIQAGVPRVDDGPTVFALPDFTQPTIDLADDSPSCEVGFSDADDWANEVGGYMFIWGSPGQNASINYYRGPYRYFGKATGAGSPPSTPQAVTPPFYWQPGQRIFLKIRFATADARITAPVYVGPEDVTAYVP